ncbi:YuiB family protein [Rubeoparvulum massiliense]|uniref:YuiB family protein n=1 Tax=Rubeoparvulum massiliense TaxID=1631346 RepID=UPI00065E7430|nr:YuiB family protein [Rubeoparvulum massiliense]
MKLAQLIISIPLFLVLCYMIGFILNMLIKTTWLPLFIYAGIVLWMLYKTGGHFFLAEYVVFFSGLAGTLLSVFTIRFLRRRGYSMF